MKKLFWLLICLFLVFVIHAVFFGGDYVRFAGERLNVKMDKIADFADTFRLDKWMAEKSSMSRSQEKRRLGN
jgi:hypothetical protein